MAKNSGQAKFEACMVLSGVGDAIGLQEWSMGVLSIGGTNP